MVSFAQPLAKNMPTREILQNGNRKEVIFHEAEETCLYCGDDAMLPLREVITIRGHRYSSSVPCQWCEKGTAARRRLERRNAKWRDLHYGEEDVVLASDGEPLPPAEQQRRVAAMIAMLKSRPPARDLSAPVTRGELEQAGATEAEIREVEAKGRLAEEEEVTPPKIQGGMPQASQ